MTLDEIDRLGLSLFRDPELRVPMADALEDLGLRWLDWLERGTLVRLAECMAWIMEGGFRASSAASACRSWIEAVLGRSLAALGGPSSWYATLCASFSVSPLLIQIEEIREIYDARLAATDLHERLMARVNTGWLPPSMSLAVATLRWGARQELDCEARGADSAMLGPPPNELLGRLSGDRRGTPRAELEVAVRHCHSNAYRFRIRTACGSWQTHELARPWQ